MDFFHPVLLFPSCCLLWDPCDHLGVSKRMVIWGRCGRCWFIPSLWTPHTLPSITANSIGGRELATQPVFGNSRSRTRSPAGENVCKWPTNKPRTCNIQTRWTPGRKKGELQGPKCSDVKICWDDPKSFKRHSFRPKSVKRVFLCQVYANFMLILCQF